MRVQEDLDRLHEWTLKWQISFNAEKCKVLRLGRPNLDEKYKLDNTELDNSECEKDLGVLISSDLKPSNHCISFGPRGQVGRRHIGSRLFLGWLFTNFPTLVGNKVTFIVKTKKDKFLLSTLSLIGSTSRRPRPRGDSSCP